MPEIIISLSKTLRKEMENFRAEVGPDHAINNNITELSIVLIDLEEELEEEALLCG